MSASSSDKITDTRNAARPNSAKASGTRSAGGTTLACDSLVGWPTVSKVHFVTYQIDANSNPVAGTQLDCTGIVSGNSLTSIVVVDGTDAGNAVNDVVEMLPTANWGHELFTALTKEHNQLDGSHKAITTDTITVTSGSTLPAGDIGTADIAAGAITTAKLATGIQPATVASNPYKFSVYRTASYTAVSATPTAMPYDTKTFDTGSNVDVVTNKGRFTAPIAGFYQFNARYSTPGTSNIDIIYLYKNGSEALRGNEHFYTANPMGVIVSGLLQLAANDYIEVYYNINGTPAVDVGQSLNYFQGFLVSAT